MPGKNNQNFDILNRLRRMKNNDRNGRDLVKLFYEEAKRFPLLTHKEGIALAKEGTPRALNRLAECNLRLVFKIASEFQNSCDHLKFADLIQEGMLGLGRAVIKFDWQRGCRFSTYAQHHIRARIMKALTESNRVLHRPSSAAKKGITIGVDYEDDAFESIPDDTAHDKVDGGIISKDRRRVVGEIIKIAELSAREHNVILRRMNCDDDDEETLEEIGKKLGISRERVRQVEKQALLKLRVAAGFLGYSRSDIF